jgi:Tol biopolymer transport system component
VEHKKKGENGMGPIQNNQPPADDQIERLTSFRGNASGLTSSPRKNEIARTGTHEGNSEIYSMNLDSSTVNNVTKHPAADYGPQFSPDGTKLLFTSRRAKSHEDPSATSWSQDKIIVSNTDGTHVRNLTVPETKQMGSISILGSEQANRCSLAMTRWQAVK